MVDPVLGVPVSLLISDPERAVGLHADAVGCPESGRHDLGRLAVRRDLEERAVVGHNRRQSVAGALGVIKIAGHVGLEPHRKLVEVLGHLVVVIERVVAVGESVTVEIHEPHDPVAAANMDHPVDHLDPERLKEPRGDPPPGKRPGGRSDPPHLPDIAVPG